MNWACELFKEKQINRVLNKAERKWNKIDAFKGY